jgi:UDP-2,3-diacylglucosamine hydrolase
VAGSDAGVFVSDVHLQPERARGGRERTRLFLEFLSEAASRVESGRLEVLYILGDLFDAWYEAGGVPPSGYAPVLGAIRDAVRRGLRVVALRGNRDFLLGPAFVGETGAELAGEELAIMLGGRRALLCHGDGLATRDRRYKMWKRFSRGLLFRRLAAALPRWAVSRVAAALRRGSELEKRSKPPYVMEHSDDAVRARVAAGFDIIIAGHVHRPADRAVRARAREGRLVVLGEWGSARGACAEWDGRELRLVR